MAQPPPTRLHIDPPIDHWQVTPRNGRTKPIIATGHQPTLWHPGILAKLIAADTIARQLNGHTAYVTVGHNPIDPLAIDIPIQHGGELSVRRLSLDRRHDSATLPPNVLPAIDAQEIKRELSVDDAAFIGTADSTGTIERILQAYHDSDYHGSLADQTRDVLTRLYRPYVLGAIDDMPSSAIIKSSSFLDRLMGDPVGCVRSYNRAASAYPEAGIRPLYLGRDVVEVPLWAQGDGVCVPLYIDLGDTGHPLLFCSDPSIELTGPDVAWRLRPRAITLSAIMRSELCDLFIHGRGGGVYDKVTDRWWHDWTGEDLAPMVVVSADVYLPFDVPTATAAELAKAQWFAHHLPHNIERTIEINGDAEAAYVNEKRDLLDRMNDDRDSRRRAKAFKRIHAINAELARSHQAALEKARQRLADRRIGLANAKIASRRDWCFALYPEAQLRALSDQIQSLVT